MAVLIGGGIAGGGNDLEVLNDLAPPQGQAVGSEPTISIANFRVNAAVGDAQDVFRYRAHQTGKLLVEAFASNNQVSIDVVNQAGTSLIGGAQAASEVISLPAVEGELYYFVVNDTNGETGPGTVYALEIENLAAPVPSGVSLDPASDTGSVIGDGITSDSTPSFVIQNDLGTYLDIPRSDVKVGVIDSEGAVGYDTDLVVTNRATGDVTIVDADRLGTSAAWQVTAPALPDGGYIVSSRTRVIAAEGSGTATNLVDVFLLFDDTGSFSSVAPTVASVFPAIVADLKAALPGVDLAFGVGRFEEYAGFLGENSTGRPFILNQPILPTSNAGFDTALAGALSSTRQSPGDGGDLPETAIEALFQTATGLGFDGNGDGDTLDSGAAGLGLTQVNPGSSGDVPNFSSFTADPTAPGGPTIAGPGTLGGAGFRAGAKHLILLATDDGFVFQSDGINPYTGVGGVTVPASTFQSNGRSTTPGGRGAAIQQTINALVGFDGGAGIEVITLGATSSPRPNLEAISLLTGAVNRSAFDLDGGVVGDPVQPGEPLYFQINPGSATAIASAIVAGVSSATTSAVAGFSLLSEPIFITIAGGSGGTLTPAAAPDLLASSDTGMSDTDNVTSIRQIAVTGVGPQNLKVDVFARRVVNGVPGAPLLVGEGTIGTALSDGDADLDGLWEITLEPLADGVYDLFAVYEDAAGNRSPEGAALRVWIDTEAPNTPFLDLTTDTGRSSIDDTTIVNRPTVVMRSNATTAGGAVNAFPNDVKFRLYVRPEGTIGASETLVYDSFTEFGGFTTLADLTRTVSLVLNDPAGTAIPDGRHNFKLEIEDRAGNISPDFLLPFTIDTVVPPVSFGNTVSVTDGLIGASDTGVLAATATLSDRITSDSTPTLFGDAEANAIVRLFADNGDGVFGAGDLLLGQTVAIPVDGNNAFAGGRWEITSAFDLNEPSFFLTRDGLRRLFVTGEDLAGNVNTPTDGVADAQQSLTIFVDTQGPRVQNVLANGSVAYDLFDPKPSTNGPTPLVNSLTIDFVDAPARIPGFQYPALNSTTVSPGDFLLVGDFTGVVAVASLTQVDDPINGTTRVTLNFAKPLPDDRFTLTVNDSLFDNAGNALDGESNAAQPLEEPTFPSGDGVTGGDFVARFTVDTRPEIGAFVAQNISIDANGNFIWDPASGVIGGDATNRDLSFTLPVRGATGAIAPGGYNVNDLAFAGKFSLTPGGVADGFDTLAAFGHSSELGAWRWLIDRDHDGVVTPTAGDILSIQSRFVSWFDTAGAIPVAGNFDGNAANGDEIGLYNRGAWLLDSDRDFVLTAADTLFYNGLMGHPIVGDFDGDGRDDAAVFNNNQLFFNFAIDGLSDAADQMIVWGYPGVLDRPVAADFDRDGIDDIGLWVPRNSSATVRPTSEWYLKLSGNPALAARPANYGTAAYLNHPFTPVPFGNDLYAEFGDELALPIVGNFDPPVASGGGSATPAALTASLPGDYDGNRTVDHADLAVWRGSFGSVTDLRADGNGDGQVNSADYSVWADHRTPPPVMPAGLAAALVMAGDIDANGRVDSADGVVWRRAYGTSNQAADINRDGRVDAADYSLYRDRMGSVAVGFGSMQVTSSRPALAVSGPVEQSEVRLAFATAPDAPAPASPPSILPPPRASRASGYAVPLRATELRSAPASIDQALLLAPRSVMPQAYQSGIETDALLIHDDDEVTTQELSVDEALAVFAGFGV